MIHRRIKRGPVTFPFRYPYGVRTCICWNCFLLSPDTKEISQPLNYWGVTAFKDAEAQALSSYRLKAKTVVPKSRPTHGRTRVFGASEHIPGGVFMRKLRWLSLLLFVLVLPGLASAQERTTVTGTVTEAGTGLPLRNAQVTIPALRISVPTDLNGRFAIQVPSGAHTLQINLIGYKTVNRPFTAAGTPQTLNFTLETDPL